MYHPYLRGKQFELILLRDNSSLISESNFCPIIEPVRENTNSLLRTIDRLIECNVKFILIINPQFGSFVDRTEELYERMMEDTPLSSYDLFSIGYIVNSNSDENTIRRSMDRYSTNKISLIHYGFPRGRELSNIVQDYDYIDKHIFIDSYTGRLYQRYFRQENKPSILVKDGFTIRKNAEYPEYEQFSDLHITYPDENMNGFGDYLIVGDEFRVTGGPAYAVAIHITFLDEDSEMYVRHFISDRTDSPTDPAGKYLEALNKLVVLINDQNANIFRSNAIEEFVALHQRGHFPGLGYVKKLSMQHHLELMSHYFSRI